MQCQKDIELARSAAGTGNHKGAVTNTYDAIRTAVACQMNASGLRMTNQQGAHVAAVDYAAERMEDVFDEIQLAQYEQLRRLRHLAEYPFSSPTHLPVTGKDAAVAVALADETVKAVIAWWARKSGQASVESAGSAIYRRARVGLPGGFPPRREIPACSTSRPARGSPSTGGAPIRPSGRHARGATRSGYNLSPKVAT